MTAMEEVVARNERLLAERQHANAESYQNASPAEQMAAHEREQREIVEHLREHSPDGADKIKDAAREIENEFGEEDCEQFYGEDDEGDGEAADGSTYNCPLCGVPWASCACPDDANDN